MPSIPSARWNEQVKPVEQMGPAQAHPFWSQVINHGNEMRSRQGEMANLVSGAGTAQEAKNIKRRMRRRLILDGYPKITPFETIEQSDRYMKGSIDGHTCLICGNTYRAVGIHLAKLHAVDLVEYLDAYGLPRTFGLASEETKDLHRNALSQTIESGHWKMMGTAEQAILARRGKSKSSETRYKQKSNVARSTKFHDADFWQVIASIKNDGLTASEVLALRGGLPSYASLRRWKTKDAVRQSAFFEAVDSLPFAKQAKMNMLGDRFNVEVVRLRKENKTIDEISAIVGVDRVAINMRLRRLVPGHSQLKLPPKTHCPAGHEYAVRFDDAGRRLVYCRRCDLDRKKAKA